MSVSAGTSYPEREIAREPGPDRLVAELGFRWHAAFRRRLPEQAAPVAEVQRHAARFSQAKLDAQLPGLRYRLRREGLQGALSAECLGLCCAALGAQAPGHVLGSAALLLEGQIVELADAGDRRLALLLAALANSVHGTPVHWLTASEAQARNAASALRTPLERLGLAASAVRCAPLRDIAFDYLRDRLQIGSRVGALRGRLERLAGDARAPLRLQGLQCALVEDADRVMLDDAHVPLVMSADADPAGESLVREQAGELARVLVPGSDFTLEENGARLSADGARRLAELSLLLGPAWAVRERREELVLGALNALHQGQAGLAAAPREILFRTSVPRFLGRYLHLAGVCADARRLDAQFWSLYRLRTSRAGPPAAEVPCTPRVFRSAAARRATLLEAAQREGVVIAVRTKAEAQALASAGIEPVSLYPAFRTLERSPRAAHLVVAELHDARRHVAELQQAFGAQSCELLLALEEEAVARALGPLLAKGIGLLWKAECPAAVSRWLAGRAQRGVERAQALVMRDLVSRERQLEDLLAFSGQRD